VQLTTDGHKAYLTAVDRAFDKDIDFAQLVKMYGGSEGGNDRRRNIVLPNVLAAKRQK
jgi:hypothetical protein